MPNRVYTCDPFTLAICRHCSAEPQSLLIGLLSNVIRQCPHAVLVSTDCLLGEFTCATINSDRTPILVLQPCSVDRVPNAAAIWIGPVNTDADARSACNWIAAGGWDRANLPLRLRADLNLSRASSQN